MPIVLRSTGAYYPSQSIQTTDLMAKEHPHLLLKRRLLMVLGCESVHVGGAEDTPATMAAESACQALENAGWGSEDVQTIMTVGCTLPDVDVWSASAKVAQLLDALHAECLGVGDVACAGSFAALRVLRSLFISEKSLERAVLCAGCMMPGGRVFIPATVFGDGSGAFVLEKMARRPKGKLELKHVVVRSHPEFIDAFGPIAGFNRLREKGRLEPEDWSFAVRDADAYSALSKVNYDLGASVLADNLASVKWKPDSVTRLLTDNVTKSVGFALAERVGIPEDRVYVDGCRTRGHAFAADMFANMHHSLETNALESKERIVSMGMGLGQHWGLALWQS